MGEVCEGGTVNETVYALKEHIKTTLRDHMEANRWTVSGMARHLGLPRGVVSWTVKSSGAFPPWKRVVQIADVLGLDVEVTFKRRVQ